MYCLNFKGNAFQPPDTNDKGYLIIFIYFLAHCDLS